MQLHLASFLQAFETRLPLDIAWFHRNYTLFLFARFPVNLTFLQEILLDTLRGTPPETPSETPHETPLSTLLDTLRETLVSSDTYLTKHKHDAVGERQETLWEYQIDLNVIQGIITNVWLYADMCQAWSLIRDDDFVSVRVLQAKLLMATGKPYSLRCVNRILDALTQEGLLRDNGRMRTRGREVVK